MHRVGHAPESGDGDREPTVDEETHARAADGQGVEEERIHDEPGCAYQEEDAVPLVEPLGLAIRRRVPPAERAGDNSLLVMRGHRGAFTGHDGG